MARAPSLQQLWAHAPAPVAHVDPTALPGLPEPARRLLCHSLAPGVAGHRAVQLTMHGEIKLRGWCPFRATQVLRADGQMIWAATVWVGGLPVFGFDRLVDGEGAMRWRLLGLLPIAEAAGPDVTRSTVGRAQIECIWLPTLLAGPDARWSSDAPDRARVEVPLLGQPADLSFTLAPDGRPTSVTSMRWGNPGGGAFAAHPFGAWLDAERTFEGLTIPTEVRVGWYFGTPRFETEGEFFRGTVDDVRFVADPSGA